MDKIDWSLGDVSRFSEGHSKNCSDTSTPEHRMGDSQRPRPLERSVLILYGSETGNAQEVAEELGALTERLRFATHVSELNQCKPVCTFL